MLAEIKSKKMLKRRRFQKTLLRPAKVFNEWLFKNKESDIFANIVFGILAAVVAVLCRSFIIGVIKTSLVLTAAVATIVVFIGLFVHIAIEYVCGYIVFILGSVTEYPSMLYDDVNEDIEEYFYRTIRTYIKREEKICPIGVIYDEKE